jgi:hypothetical protein
MEVTKSFWVLVLLLGVMNEEVHAESFDNVKTEIDNVVFGPSVDGMDTVRPVADSAQALNVTLDWNMISINDFDETNGYIELSGFVTLEWVPDAYTASAVDLTEMLKNDRMWTPSIILVNSLKGYNLIGYDTSVKVRMNLKTLNCKWQPWIITRVACSPNVKFYPFDRQACALRFSVWGYTDSEVKLMAKGNEWAFQYFEENGEWKIESTSTETSVIGDSSVIDFKIELVRRPLYHVINMIAPVILLGALNAFTFLLPVESGERVGFAITCFLSYVVLLNMIMGFLPSSAAPLSYLSYYTFVMMLFSAGVSILTVVTIRIHNKSEDDHVPAFIDKLYRCFTSKSSGPSNRPTEQERAMKMNTVSTTWDIEDWGDEITPVNKHELVSQRNKDSVIEEIEEKHEKLSWPKVAALIDLILFLAFLGCQAFFSVAYLVPIFVNK